MVFLAVAAACFAAAVASPLPADAVVLVQRALQSGQAARRWRIRSRLLDQTSSFKAGDSLEFRVAGSRWLNCTVLEEGQRADTYTIRVPALPDGQRDLKGVPASLLRDPQKETARVAARLQAEQTAEEEKRRRERQEVILFEDKEDVLLMGKGKGAGKWFPARILHAGQHLGTYDVRLNTGMLVKNVEAKFLKKTHEMHFEACETVDVPGPGGKLMRTKVLGPGADVGTVNLRNPLSVNEVLKDIPVLALRKVKKASLRANASSAAGATASANATNSSTSAANGTGAASEAAAARPTALLELGAELLRGAGANATAGSEANATAGSEANATAAVQAYEVGQPMWVQLEDAEVQPWVRGKILREGDFPGTYDLRVTAKIPSYDLCDVPVSRLQETQETIKARADEEARRKAEEEEKQRAAEEEERRRAEKAAQKKAEQDRRRKLEEEEAHARAKQQAVNKVLSVAAYRPGQELQFNARGSQWINCTVSSLAVKPHVYDIYVPSFPEGLREISDVNGKALRSFEEAAQQEAEEAEVAKKLAEEARAKAQKEHTFEPQERVQVRVKGTDSWAEAVIKEGGSAPDWYVAEVEGKPVRLHSSVLRRDPDHTFEEGETVQIRSSDSNAWVPCTVTRKGVAPNTYNIYFATGPVGHRDQHNVDARRLHRIKFTTGQPVEVYMKRGPSKGMWVESRITGSVADKRDTYSVHVFDSPREYNISQVAYKLIRRSEAHIARWREKLEFEAQLREDARLKREAEQREKLEWLRNHTFKEGECVQVETQVNGTGIGYWINATIASEGSAPNTYTLMWKEKFLKNVRREIIRKDPVRQAAKEERDEKARKQVMMEEAQRKVAFRARAKAAEEGLRMAEEKRRRMEEAAERGEAAESADEDIEIVTAETLARLVREAEVEMAKAKERRKTTETQLERRASAAEVPVDEEEDFAKRQAEWDEILKEVDGEEEGEAGAADGASKQESAASTNAVQAEQAAAEAPKEAKQKSGEEKEKEAEKKSSDKEERPAGKPSKNVEEKTAEKPEGKAAQKPGDRATEKPEEKAAEKPEGEPTEKPQEQPVRKKKKTFKQLEAEKAKRKAEAKKAKDSAPKDSAPKSQKKAAKPVTEVKWTMDAETAKRQAEWDAMIAEDEQKADAEADQ